MSPLGSTCLRTAGMQLKEQRKRNVIDDPYTEFSRGDMILRDWLALDRTVLANKRTFLAYGRTSIALIALGIAFVKLIDHRFFEISGFFLMGTGIVVLGIGLREFIANTLRFKRLVLKEQAVERKIRDEEREAQSSFS
jgi:putative membrane protein